MMADVPKADLVAMNPSHYAVALRYDAAKMKAPRVVAKGADLIAFQIRRVAEAHNVPIFEHPQFARALYYTSEIGKEVSPRLYVAVAQVLTYIYQLTGRTSAPGKRPRAAAGQGQAEDAGARRSTPSCSEPRRGRASRHEAQRMSAAVLANACRTSAAWGSACRCSSSRCSRWSSCRCRRSCSTRSSRSTSRCRS